MARGHHEAGWALEHAIFNLPEPRFVWRDQLGGEDWEQAKGPGSGNIGLMAAVALYRYSKLGQERELARRMLLNYHRICRGLWQLSEPDSVQNYEGWIVLSWGGVVQIAEERGDTELAAAFTELIVEWGQRCEAMEDELESAEYEITPEIRGPEDWKVEVRKKVAHLLADLRECVGKLFVLRTGCRCWHDESPGPMSAVQQLWRAIRGRGEVKANDKPPGSQDGVAWTARAMKRLTPLFRRLLAGVAGKGWERAIANVENWSPARTAFQYIGYANGDRVAIMGEDEAAPKDGDPNNNTPGGLLIAMIGGRIYFLPEWPNWHDGDSRIRQLATFADIDYDPVRKGWLLVHSLIGRTKNTDGNWESFVAEPNSPKIFHLHCSGRGGRWRNLLADAPPAPPPTPGPGPGRCLRRRRRRACRRGSGSPPPRP